MLTSLLSFFRDDRPKFKRPDAELREVAVRVLTYQDVEQLKKLKTTLYVTVPDFSTVGDLKQRLSAMTSIPKPQIRLMLCGTALSDNDPISPEVFEPTQKSKDEDDELYRPRLYLSIQAADPIAEVDVQSEVSELSDLGMEEDVENPNDEELPKTAEDIAAEAEMANLEKARKEAEEAEERDIAERYAQAAALEAALHESVHKRSKVFSLKKDLERIMCGHFYEQMKAAGFDDEGAFSEITHDALLEKGLWVPRKARTRMVALADILKRKIDQRSRRKSVGKDKLTTAMFSSGALKGVAIEGIDAVMLNKRDINNAYKEQVKKAEAEERDKRLRLQALEAAQLLKKNPEPKAHSPDLQIQIDRIRWACQRDEFDVPVNLLRVAPSVFCCPKHKKEVLDRRDAFMRQCTERNRSEMSMQIKLADVGNNGFLSRDILRVLTQQHFKKRGFPLPDGELETLLDTCIVDGEDQKEMFEWTAKEKYRRANPFGFIPVAIYDSNYLVEVLVHKLEALEYDRFVYSEEDKKGKYIVHDFSDKDKDSTVKIRKEILEGTSEKIKSRGIESLPVPPVKSQEQSTGKAVASH